MSIIDHLLQFVIGSYSESVFNFIGVWQLCMWLWRWWLWQ